LTDKSVSRRAEKYTESEFKKKRRMLFFGNYSGQKELDKKRLAEKDIRLVGI